jgi:plastocyanin
MGASGYQGWLGVWMGDGRRYNVTMLERRGVLMRRLIAVAVVPTMLLSSSAGATTQEVQFTDNIFSPERVRVRVGERVEWFRGPSSINPHNIRQDRGVFSSGPPSDMTGYERVFSAGSFPYHCTLHGAPGGEGMSGLVRVPVTLREAPAGLPFTVRWATAASETGRSFDVQFRVGSGKWRAWKRGVTAKRAVFGKRGKPVRVQAGKRYSFRARSRAGGGATGWSPLAGFTP